MKMGKDKFKEEYMSTNNREAFVKLVLKHYPHLKPASATRRFYDMRKKYGLQKNKVEKMTEVTTFYFEPDELSQPSVLKMIEFDDMKEMGYILTDSFLKQHGFNKQEINWLKMNGKI